MSNCSETLQGGCWSSTKPRVNVPNFLWRSHECVGAIPLVYKGIAAMTQYVKHVRFRKFSPVDREYPIFELVEGDNVLLDVSSSDDGVLEVALHEASIGKIFKLDDLHTILIQGKRLLEEEMACEP